MVRRAWFVWGNQRMYNAQTTTVSETRRRLFRDEGTSLRTEPSPEAFPCLDFFAGSGLVTEGLKDCFSVVWANDICPKKADVFCANHDATRFHLGPVEDVRGAALPRAVLSWGSFPCQDLSLAGAMSGFSGSRSSLFRQWLRVMDELPERPPIAVAENVIGLISAMRGQYYRELHAALADRGYSVGAVVLDAIHWLPQSRKRVFVIAVDRSVRTDDFDAGAPVWCHPEPLVRAAEGLENRIWWGLPEPLRSAADIESVIDFSLPCFDRERLERLLDLIPPAHRDRMMNEASRGRRVFPGYKRTRRGKQTLELRFDGVAGCLRTPEGGSSRQYVVIVEDGKPRARLLSLREVAALMGAREDYKIPGSYNDGYRAMGDAVAVPVTRFLASELLFPLARRIREKERIAS